MSASSAENECSICESRLQMDDEKVTTECGHTFHRKCAQIRLDQRRKSDCRRCGKQAALAKALMRHRESTISTQRDSNNTKPMEERKRVVAPIPISKEESDETDDDDDKMKKWPCLNCSMTNTESTKRCESCGEPRDTVSMGSYTTAVVTTTVADADNRKLLMDKEQQDHYYNSYETRAEDERHETRTIPTASRNGNDKWQQTKRETDQYDYLNSTYTSESSTKYSNDDEEDETPGTVDYEYIPRMTTHQRSPRSSTPSSDTSSAFGSYRLSSSQAASSTHSIAKTGFWPQSYDDNETKSRATADPSKGTTRPQHEINVYIPDLPTDTTDNIQLERQIRQRIESILKLNLGDIKCYTKLGVGLICVDNDRIRDQLINDIGSITLDAGDGKTIISFVAQLELVSYIVLEVTKVKDSILPTADEISRRWIELYKSKKQPKCERLSSQFSNIYKIVSTSLDELLVAMQSRDFPIKGHLGQIYFRADCSFFEDLPRSITKDQLQKTIMKETGQANVPSSSIHIQLNKEANSACILVTDTARVWSRTSYLVMDGKIFSKKENLTCRLRIFPVPQSFAVHKITNHQSFTGKVVSCKQHGENVILELSDTIIFDDYLTRGMLRIDDQNQFHIEAYVPSINPEESEINEDSWYKTEMPRYKPDIMQFVADPKHPIFQYKWNSQIWLEQFKRTIALNHGGRDSRDQRNTPDDKTRHQLRVTAMLHTLAVVRKNSYMIGDQEIKLKIDNKMKTIVYDHRSKLQRGNKLSLTKPPYPNTRVDVSREDCLVVYERLVNNGFNPLLLNMANATTPGGGYRKGDGAQEENLFRRSDYFRSLDIGLDQWLPERSEHFHCSSNCQLDPLTDLNSMYPMDEFGAIYTSDLTVFRRSEDAGYALMDKPLKGVCSLAMAAYRDPKLDDNMLASKFAVGTRKKIENIFAIAFHHKHDSLVLSAFGCGAFKNPPGHIAQLFCSVMEQYAGFFKLITFAIIDDHNAGQNLNPEGNFKPFKDILDGMGLPSLLPLNKPHTIFGPYRILSDDLSIGDICIFDKTPCNYGAKCNEIHNRKHAQEFSHPPLCPHASMKGKCEFTKDSVHMNSFIHRNQCQYGGECRQIDEENHTREYDHPSYCQAAADCHDLKESHLKEYRHLPLCPEGPKCIDYRKHIRPHYDKFRHCAVDCPYGNYCINFHDQKHLDKFEHPFPTPCPWTPFHCELYLKLTEGGDHGRPSDDIQQHCLDFAHVCRYGRNCTDKSDLHWETTIHIARHLCSDDDKCTKLKNEDHLNSFTHSKIPDIRLLCKRADGCHDRRKLDHIIKFQHAAKFEHNGILRYFNLNKKTNFVQNQKDSIERVTAYVQSQKWKSLPSGNVPYEIINWIRTVQPVHRCNPIIFESILLHGHVMSREYMINLKSPPFVANSVLQHSRIRRIEALQEKIIAERAKTYIIALVSDHFKKGGFLTSKTAGSTTATGTVDDAISYATTIKKQEVYLSSVLQTNDLEAIRTKSLQIAEASMNLHMNPSGIGFDKDKDLGTDKTVFSILGPHLGHYYGDVFIVFKREILHHPDANFSIQAATSFTSDHAFQMRPWLGANPSSHSEGVKLYHRSKLNASIPGYEYATALELIALTSHHFKLKTMDIDLKKILERWIKVDSHTNIEGHLPQLIPISYIDHIYIPQNLYDSLSADSRKAINANFKHCITIVKHDGEANQPHGPRGPTPSSKSRAEYQKFVIEELSKRYSEYLNHPPSRSVRGAAITIASTDFTDHYIMPLTISQAYEQYCFAKKHPPADQTTFIYWQVRGGDMMLTLSNEPIESGEKQPNLRCLTCYIAAKPSGIDTSYHEHYSYLNNSTPFQHHILRETGRFAAKSNRFHVGCNTDDLMTFCLQIERSNGTVTLTHAGPNSIYNHEKISCTFRKSEIDLSKLIYVHVSSGARTVPVRNLIICFEKQADLHPTFDKNFKKTSSSSAAHSSPDRKKRDDSKDTPKAMAAKADDNDEKKSPGFLGQVKRFFLGDESSQLTPCRDNVNCLIQYSSRDGSDHNDKYSHPCRFSELCHDKEPHLTHEPHQVSMCKHDKSCKQLDDPFHRAEYRHTDLPDFLKPCRDKAACHDKSNKHRITYSHGEQVYKTNESAKKEARASSPAQRQCDRDQRTPCKWGSTCRDIGDRRHREQFSHPTAHRSKGNEQQDNDHRPFPCKYGSRCSDSSDYHRRKYSHPQNERQTHHKTDQRTPCKYGLHCPTISDASHRAKYSHLQKEGQLHHKIDQRTPCMYGLNCPTITDASHRARYSHPKASLQPDDDD